MIVASFDVANVNCQFGVCYLLVFVLVLVRLAVVTVS